MNSTGDPHCAFQMMKMLPQPSGMIHFYSGNEFDAMERLKKKKNTKSKNKIEIIFKENYFFPCIFKCCSFQNNPAYSTPQTD